MVDTGDAKIGDGGRDREEGVMKGDDGESTVLDESSDGAYLDPLLFGFGLNLRDLILDSLARTTFMRIIQQKTFYVSRVP